MAKYLDWFNIMSKPERSLQPHCFVADKGKGYDLHGTWDSSSPWLGPYVNAHTNLTEIGLALDLLWRNDIDPKKVVLGIGYDQALLLRYTWLIVYV